MNTFKNLTYHADALGKYHSGLFYSDTVFPDAVINPRTAWIDLVESDKYKLTEYDWRSPLDVLNTSTLYHETIHYLQDLATGFGCAYCFATRDFLHHMSGTFRKLGVTNLRLPIAKWAVQETNPAIKSRLDDYLATVQANPRFIESTLSSTQYMVSPNFKHFSSLSGYEGLQTDSYHTLSAMEIIEGMAFLLTKKNVEETLVRNNLSNRMEFVEVVDYKNYGDLYRSAINAFEVGLFSIIEPEYLSREFIDNLFLLIADFALLIPPPSQEIVNKLNIGELEYSVFNPLSRFTAICGNVDNRIFSHRHDKTFDWVFEWLDEISKKKNWLSIKSTTKLWIDYLEYLHQKTSVDVTISWQIEAMKIRLNEPTFVLGWFGGMDKQDTLYSAIQKIGAPMFYRTSSGNQWRYFPKSNDAEDFQNGLDLKDKLVDIFTQRSISMVVADHILFGSEMMCPIYGWICDCGGRNVTESKNVFLKYLDNNQPCPARKLVEIWLDAPYESIFNKYIG
jgi:hypothetical protein